MANKQLLLPSNRLLSNSNRVSTGGTASLFLSGTTTPANFLDGNGVSLGPVLTADGLGVIPTAYGDEGTAYRLVLKDRYGTPLDGGDLDPFYFGTVNGEKGDPGANVLSIGTFSTAHSLTIPAGTHLVEVSGTSTDGDDGAGRRFVEDAAVTTGFVSANPLISFRDATGRGFREVDPRTGDKIVPFVLAITGQSNAAGGNNGGPNPASPGVKTWNGSTNAWGSSDYTQVPWTLGNPYGNGGNNNYALAAAHRIYFETRRPVYIVFYATGGMAISNWVGAGTSSTMYAGLKSKIEAALATPELASAGVTQIDALIWAQGEEDGTREFDGYSADLATLDAQFRAETWFDTYTPIITPGLAQVHEHYEIQGALQYYAANTNPAWHFIPTRGFPSDGGSHWTGPALWEIGYNRIAPAIFYGSGPIERVPFYSNGSGRISPSDIQAISTFDSLCNWTSRTDGPGVVDTFNGDGTTTVFTLTSRGIVTSVTVGGTVLATPADYSISGLTLTFTSAPALGTGNIVVAYRAAINGPNALGAFTWGYRCYADGNYTMAGGYLSYTSNACAYTALWGARLTANDAADYCGGFGLSNSLQNSYQGCFGRGHTLLGLGEFVTGLYSKYQDGSRCFQVGIGTAGAPKNALSINASQGNIEIYAPTTAADPGDTNQITFKAVSNTSIKLLMKGTDGTVRSVTLTLA